MSNQHTPGPWRVSTGLYVDDSRDIPVANIKAPHGRVISESVANARLIAKAPEMYAMVKALDYISRNDTVDVLDWLQENIRPIRELLKQIDGATWPT